VNELTVMYGNQRVTLQPGQFAHIGRRNDNAVVINDPRVSREHIRVSWTPQGGWTLENLGQAGTYVSGQPVTRLNLTQPLEARLAAPDGPAVIFSLAVPATPGRDGPAPAAPQPAFAGGGALGAGAAAGQPYWGAKAPPAHVPGAVPPSGRPGPGDQTQGFLHTLIPIRTWLTDPTLRQWPKLMVALYALAPVVLLIPLQNTSDLKTVGWLYSLYIAPLWAMVFWWLIRPGPLHWRHLWLTAAIIAAEYVLVPALTIPWEDHLGPSDKSHSLISWIYGVGVAEELTKALPVLILAIVLKARNVKLDVRMWMFLATLSGLFFGVYEASTVYVPHDLQAVNATTVFGVPELLERIFVDGLQHALWAGIAGFFIGLGINYRRQRYPLWLLGLAIPSILHGLNDWSLSGVFGTGMWVWILIQVFSVFLFIGYATSAHAIEQEVRHTPIFRGQSMLLDASVLQAAQGGAQAHPGGGQAYPGGAQAHPGGGQAYPGGAQAHPGGGQAYPGGGQAYPGGVQAPPGAR
jgi:RsiW-degrading membrane proteinase PrsW (M82 family)